MAAQNFYLGVKRGGGQNVNTGAVVSGTASAGTAVDVEVNLQINDGTNATGLTRKDALLCMETLRLFIESGGLNHAGLNLPVL